MHHRKLAVAATTAMLTALLPLGSTALADGQGPQIIAGTLVDGQGAPVAASITVSVEHSTPEGDVETPIATGFSTPSGKFIIRGGLGNAPATVNPDGSVQLEVDAQANGQERIFTMGATPPAPAAGRPDWTWGDVVNPDMLPAQAQAPGLPNQVNAQAQAHAPLSGLQLDTGTTLDAATSNATVSPSSTSSCSGSGANYIGFTYVWKNLDTWAQRMVPIMHYQLDGRTSDTYEWDTTNKTEIGVAIMSPSQTYAGGMSYSEQESGSTGVGPVNINTNYFIGTEKVNWNFRKQRKYCRVLYTNYHVDTATDTYRWKAWELLGGNGHPADNTVYNCNWSQHYDQRIQDPFYTRNGYTKVYKGGFNLAGIGLNASQETSTEHKQTISVRHAQGYTYARICGYNNYPAQAPLAFEVNFQRL